MHCRHHVDHRPCTQHQQFVRSKRSDHHVWIAVQVHIHAGRQTVAEGPQWLDQYWQLPGIYPLGWLGLQTAVTSTEYIDSSLALIRCSNCKVCTVNQPQ